MNKLILIILFITFVQSKPNSNRIKTTQYQFLNEWNKWKETNKRKYNTPSEALFRRNVFLSNAEKISKLNSQRTSEEDAKFTINKFADITTEEFRVRLGKRSFDDLLLEQMKENEIRTRNLKQKKSYRLPVPNGDVPKQYSACIQDKLFTSYDTNAVNLCGSIVFDQGNCGDCYAVSNAHGLQTKYANLTYHRDGKPTYTMFSSQMLMDCTVNGYYCEGGFTELPFTSSHYIVTDDDYPYVSYYDTETKHKCKKNLRTPIMSTFTLFDGAEHIEILKRILYHYGSFVTCIYAPDNWAYYDSGIYSFKCEAGVATNHVVEVVGYGEDNGKQYIVIRNSWGPSWGISGFIKISADSLCGIGGDDGGIYPVSIILHADFSDKEYGPYGATTNKVEVEPKLYDGNDKYDIYDVYSGGGDYDGFDGDIETADILTILLVVIACVWVVISIIVVLLVLIHRFKR